MQLEIEHRLITSVAPNAFNVATDNFEDMINNVNIPSLVKNLGDRPFFMIDLTQAITNLAIDDIKETTDRSISIFTDRSEIAELIGRQLVLNTVNFVKIMRIYSRDVYELKKATRVVSAVKQMSSVPPPQMLEVGATVDYFDITDMSKKIQFSSSSQFSLFPFVLNQDFYMSTFMCSLNTINTQEGEKSTFIFFVSISTIILF